MEVKRDVVDAIESLLAHRTEDLGCYEFVLEAWMEEAASEIKRLRSERRWIPVSERLPEEGQEVLAWNNGGQCEKPWQGCVLCEHRNGEWREVEERDLYPGVTHWMPLPEPPVRY
jgi:hypothetical protein